MFVVLFPAENVPDGAKDQTLRECTEKVYRRFRLDQKSKNDAEMERLFPERMNECLKDRSTRIVIASAIVRRSEIECNDPTVEFQREPD